MEFQQSHLRYMRPPQAPPPSSMADPNHHQPPVPPPPRPTWFSGQFQYHGHSPSPPPPNHNQQHWAPPPPPPPHAPYSAPPPYPAPPPYSGQHQYPPRPPVPPPHPPHSQIPQSYPHQVNQDWQNQSWGQHQGWEYPAHNNGEDWAAKARAWAAAKTSTDDQYPQSQFTSVGIMEENQYPNVNPHHSDVQHLSLPASSYQQYPPSVAPPYRAPESAYSGYVPDGHLPFTARKGTLIGDSNSAFHHQESSPSSLSVHQQEVPSSYSSIAGKEETSDQIEKLYKSPWVFTSTPQHHAPPPPAAGGRSVSMEQPHYAFGQPSAEPTSDLSDQPLDFTPRFSRDHDPHVQPNYTHDSGVPVTVTAVAPIHSWNSPAAPGAVYPPMHPSVPQVDPSLAIPSPIPGHSGPLFGRMPGQNFQPIIPSVSAPFGASTGTFPGDAYGASGVSDRPKKASVPNWLREEIIKKKAVIATSAPELSEEEIKSIEEEVIDKSLRKGDPADSKSIDSSRSTEEEDDEEDDVEAARTVAINQEIKRVLTEVLLKVTDELFDEIATKVLSEDDSSVAAASNYEVSPSTPAVPTLKASAKALISVKTKETDTDDVSGKSILSAPGDVLGLANYASDDDEDDDIQKFGAPNSRRSTIHQPLTTKKLPDDLSVVGNGSSVAETKENQTNKLNGESRPGRMSPNGTSGNHSAVVSELNNNVSGRESMHSTLRSRYSSKTEFFAETKHNGENVVDGTDIFVPKDNVEERVVMKADLPVENVSAKKSTSDDNKGRETRSKPDKNDSKRGSAGKEFFKEAEGDRTHVREDESHRRQDERKVKKEKTKTDDRNCSKEKVKEQNLKSGEKSKDADLKKRSSHPDDKEGRKETEKDRRTSGKEDNGRKRDRTKDEKGERLRHNLASNSTKHKRHRSSSVGSRGRNSKNQAVVSRTNDSSDESSDDSRRKLRSRKRNLSPSPVRSRRRQVSRSPHSKHSQRRHSPYSSLETTRGKRSRSRSPARRKR